MMMKDSVSVERITEHIRILEHAGGHYSRVTFTPGKDSAAAYIIKEFEKIEGLVVEIDTFYIPDADTPYNQKPLYNIIATIPGKNNADKQFIIGAHYDNSASRMPGGVWTTQWYTITAPGADDNATGVAAILEIARLMCDTSISFYNDHTIKLIAYAAEEYNPSYEGHHLGSIRHAQNAKLNNEQITGMISVDMVGFNSSQFYTAIVTNNPQSLLGKQINYVRDLFDIDIKTNNPPFASGTYSDHQSYIDEGYSAVLLIENAPPWNNNPAVGYLANPYYHTSYDTMGTVNMELTAKVTQLSLAAAAAYTGVLTDADDKVSPEEFYLAQNFPNPFNPSTTIRFNLPKQGAVQLKVYDILGKEIALLVNKEMSAGGHLVNFNAAGLSSGMYIYQLVTEGYTESRKMILLK
jgi:Zn-dependent M28 family amino/carboxypeptidase